MLLSNFRFFPITCSTASGVIHILPTINTTPRERKIGAGDIAAVVTFLVMMMMIMMFT
jgi:hypothetical protein